jgi:ubiquinone/menaquinone biosynthesis C-methylase UbiE
MHDVIEFYERYDEDNRLSADHASKIEFVVTTHVLNEHIDAHHHILELGAGTGAYSMYYAERGNEVVATDISPKHIEMIRQKVKEEHQAIKLSAEVVDAIDLCQFKTGCFDVVLCLGPIYHLTDVNDRVKCIQEALRVLKPGGILAVAYINKHYIIHAVMINMKRYFTQKITEDILRTGTCKEAGENCFISVGFLTTPAEIESFMAQFHVEIIDHAATDGITSLLRNQVNELNDTEYDVWVRYMLSNCREKSLLGISNHVLLMCRKL